LDDFFFEDRYNSNNKAHSVGFDKKIIIIEDIDCLGEIVWKRENKKDKAGTNIGKKLNLNSLSPPTQTPKFGIEPSNEFTVNVEISELINCPLLLTIQRYCVLSGLCILPTFKTVIVRAYHPLIPFPSSTKLIKSDSFGRYRCH
jgi:hypothetical protein